MVWRKCQSPLASRQTRSASSTCLPIRRCSCSMSRGRFRCSPPPTISWPAPEERGPTRSGWSRKAARASQPRRDLRLRRVRSRRLGEALDTLLVAGGEGAEAAAENPVLVDWVRERATQARRVASVCTGAFLLAAAGRAGRAPRSHPLDVLRQACPALSRRARRARSDFRV